MAVHEKTPAEKLYAGVQLTRPLLRNITARVEADLTGTGVSVGQRAILEVLMLTGQATAPEITRMLQISRQFVARELKLLMQNGMIKTVKNPHHQRSNYHQLNAKSRAVISEIRQREMAQFAEFASRFSPEEIDAFLRVQKALNDEFSQNG